MLKLTTSCRVLCAGVLAATFALPAIAQPTTSTTAATKAVSQAAADGAGVDNSFDNSVDNAFEATPSAASGTAFDANFDSDSNAGDAFGDTSAQAVAPSDMAITDPWEGYNRWMFGVDMKLDDYVLEPVARGYDKVTPDWGQAMVRNFFDNLADVRGAINALLQLKFAEAGSNLGRVLINTTMGVGGLFDVATQAGLTSYDQDFGLTLARWGVPRGPYVVLPLLGPSNVRDGLGMIPGSYAWPPHYLPSASESYLVDAAYGVSKRTDLLGYKERIIGDKYIFIRNLYLRNRALKAGKPLPQDNFGASLDDASGASGW